MMRTANWRTLLAVSATVLLASAAGAQAAIRTNEVEFILKDDVVRGGGSFAAALLRPHAGGPIRIELKRSILTLELVATAIRIADREFARPRDKDAAPDMFLLSEQTRLRPLSARERAGLQPTYTRLVALARRDADQTMRITLNKSG